MYEESWKFTVGDETVHGSFVNKALESGREYVIFQRALTHDNGVSKCKSTFQSISNLQGNYCLFESNSNDLLNDEKSFSFTGTCRWSTHMYMLFS